MRRRFIPLDKVASRAQKSAKSAKRHSASLPPKTERWSEENREKLAELIFGRPPPQLFTTIFCAFRRRFVPERRARNVFLSLTFVVSRRKSAPPRLPTRNFNNAMEKTPPTAFVDNNRRQSSLSSMLCFSVFLLLSYSFVVSSNVPSTDGIWQDSFLDNLILNESQDAHRYVFHGGVNVSSN